MIADATVRLAIISDAADIAVLSREHVEFGLSWNWREDRVTKSIISPISNVAVVERDKAVVGFGIMEYGDNDAHLVLFAVDPLHRRHGIGSAILLWLESVARAAGAERIRIEARHENTAARSFYNEHGYHERVIKKGMYAASVDGVRFEKWLRSPGTAE